jgi:hypothetical protein
MHFNEQHMELLMFFCLAVVTFWEGKSLISANTID